MKPFFSHFKVGLGFPDTEQYNSTELPSVTCKSEGRFINETAT
jgi:hypothetical protein